MRIELPKAHINQKQILDSNARFRVVCCGRRFGRVVCSSQKMKWNPSDGPESAEELNES